MKGTSLSRVRRAKAGFGNQMPVLVRPHVSREAVPGVVARLPLGHDRLGSLLGCFHAQHCVHPDRNGRPAIKA